METIVAIDAGTTGVRAVAFDLGTNLVAVSYRELPQHYPAPGLVEHDAGVIWALVEETLAELARQLEQRGATTLAIGITNQRETAVAWDRASGRPLHRAIVWQDRRTAGRCDELAAAGQLPLVRRRTGLVLDSYFSATKWAWMIEEGGVEVTPELALGTVDSWVTWNLSGGVGSDGRPPGRLVTDLSNASRTLCLDIGERAWSEELCDLFRVPSAALAELCPSSGRLATVAPDVAGGAFAGIPVSGIAGDQQAALFGQGCLAAGEVKITYGTGTFALMNVGPSLPEPVEGLITTIAWDLAQTRPEEPVAYALEGAVFATGAAIQWLRDGLGIISAASETEALARSVPDSAGVYFVPAFTGLGSPWWDPYARGTVLGLTRGAGRGHLARAVVEAISFQGRDVVDAMTAAGRPPARLYADGGASAMDLLLQMQADQVRTPVTRRRTSEATALGAALLAGLAEGAWPDIETVLELLGTEATFEPTGTGAKANQLYAGWQRAVDRARGWAKPAGSEADGVVTT